MFLIGEGDDGLPDVIFFPRILPSTVAVYNPQLVSFKLLNMQCDNLSLYHVGIFVHFELNWNLNNASMFVSYKTKNKVIFLSKIMFFIKKSYNKDIMWPNIKKRYRKYLFILSFWTSMKKLNGLLWFLTFSNFLIFLPRVLIVAYYNL